MSIASALMDAGIGVKKNCRRKRRILVACKQLAKLAANRSDLSDLDSVPAVAFGRIPAQKALKLQGHLKSEFTRSSSIWWWESGLQSVLWPVLHVSSHIEAKNSELFSALTNYKIFAVSLYPNDIM